jgi:hypothetical protein
VLTKLVKMREEDVRRYAAEQELSDSEALGGKTVTGDREFKVVEDS